MRNTLSLALISLLLLAGSLSAVAESAEYKKINKGKEGQVFNIKPHLVKGKTNVIDFYSDYCPPCLAIAPYLEKLAKKDPNVVVGKVDINRPGRKGIDWESPTAKQFKLRGIPHFKIYDGNGKLLAEGEEGKKMLMELFAKNGIQ